MPDEFLPYDLEIGYIVQFDFKCFVDLIEFSKYAATLVIKVAITLATFT